MSHRGGKRQRHYKELEPHERELEAKQFYDYVKENWARNRVRVSDLKQLYSDMEWQQRSTCMAFCKCFEILKRCRALKSKKRGVFVLNNGWPTSTGRNQKMLAAYYVDKELEEKKLTSYRATEQIFLRYVILELLRTHKKALLLDKNGVSVKYPHRRICEETVHFQDVFLDEDRDIAVVQRQRAPVHIDFVISNKVSNLYGAVEFLCCGFVRKDPVLSLHDEQEVTRGKRITIPPGRRYRVRCSFAPLEIGVTSGVVAFKFLAYTPEEQTFHIVRFVKGRCVNSVTKLVQPKTAYSPSHAPIIRQRHCAEPGQPPEGQGTLLPRVLTLHDYSVEAIDGMVQEELDQKLDIDLEEHYAEVFQHLLWVEEQQMGGNISSYNMKNAKLKRIPDCSYLDLQVPGLAEKRPSLIKGDRLYASCDADRETEFEGYVHEIQQTGVWLKFSERFHGRIYKPGMLFDIRFTFNRLPLKLQHRAVKTTLPVSVLFPVEETIGSRGLLTTTTVSRFFNGAVERNRQQRTAVERIVSGVSRPAPYIVYGPPGTGKTSTVVEAIKQILVTIRRSCVLVCAPSNSAADVLCQKLLSDSAVRKHQILRFNAISRNDKNIPSDLKEISQYDLALDNLLKFRVVVCTLVTAGKIVSANVRRGHFTHIFVDEAGYAIEPECLIPIAGLLDPKSGQVVLAGDPKQLGPVLQSQLSIECGLQMSLLERLMNCSVYERCKDQPPDQPPYNPDAVSKLLKNYRSHPCILDLPNRMFYNSELIACADESRNKMCDWKDLANPKFPIIFHGVVGEEEREANCPSFFNAEEVSLVYEYCQKLKATQGPCRVDMKKDVGIITPYRKQVMKIAQLFKTESLDGATIGSVEEFQGQERTVIIISTVRSNPDYLEIDKKFKIGFLDNPKRFNVAITRAKALLIVIGNPHLLKRDSRWKQFLEFVHSKGGYRGCPYPAEDQDSDILDNLQKLGLHSVDAYEMAERHQTIFEQHGAVESSEDSE